MCRIYINTKNPAAVGRRRAAGPQPPWGAARRRRTARGAGGRWAAAPRAVRRRPAWRHFDRFPLLLSSRDANPRKLTIFPPQPVRTSVTRRAAITNRRNLRKIERRRIQSETLKFNETAKFSIWKTTKNRANLQVSYISTVRKLYLNASILLGFLRFVMAARRITDVLSGKIVTPKTNTPPNDYLPYTYKQQKRARRRGGGGVVARSAPS